MTSSRCISSPHSKPVSTSLHRPSRPPSAFTLVELLVVIGIIAVLISILIPTLNRAREQSQRVACASNLRQVGNYLAMYNNDFKGAMPIFIPSSLPDNNYYLFAWYSTTLHGEYTGVGLLAAAGILPPARPNATGGYDKTDRGRVLYCPMPARMYNTYDDYPAWCLPGSTTRMNYSMRPRFIGVSGSDAAPYCTHEWNWTVTNYSKLPATPWIPKTSTFKNQAIMADLVDAPQHLKDQHRLGWNVLYSNYAVKFIRVEYVRGTPTAPEWEAVTDAGASTTANRPPLIRTWEHFDRL